MSDRRPALAPVLEAMPVFAGLAPADIDDVANAIRERRVKAGKVLIKKGQWGHELLVVLDGEVEVWRGDELLAVQGPGSIVGETAVLTDARRNATVVARAEATVGVIEYSQVHALVETIPLLAERIGAVARDREVPGS